MHTVFLLDPGKIKLVFMTPYVLFYYFREGSYCLLNIMSSNRLIYCDAILFTFILYTFMEMVKTGMNLIK